jgi:hypothetical protein
MTPYEVLKLFEDGYVDDHAPKIDDATAALAQWLSDNKDVLTPFDWQLLVNIGMTLFEKGMEARMERDGPAGRAMELLLDALRKKT